MNATQRDIKLINSGLDAIIKSTQRAINTTDDDELKEVYRKRIAELQELTNRVNTKELFQHEPTQQKPGK